MIKCKILTYLASSALVLLFTTALFLSGCVVQQRTLRELRAAIKPSPRPSPKIFLPDRFKQSTTELEDGSIVIVNDDTTAQEPLVVQVKHHAAPAVVAAPPPRPPPPPPPPDAEKPNVRAQRVAQEEKAKILSGDKYGPIELKDFAAEEAMKQREWNMQHQESEFFNNPDPTAEDQSLMSRAERRRLIKEELRRLHEVEARGYQRRLW